MYQEARKAQRNNESASANEQRKHSSKVLTQVAVLSHFLFSVCFGLLAVLSTCSDSLLATSYLRRLAVHLWCPRFPGAGTHVNDIHSRGLKFLSQTRPYKSTVQWLDTSESSKIQRTWPFADGVLDPKQLQISFFLCQQPCPTVDLSLLWTSLNITKTITWPSQIGQTKYAPCP